MVACRPEKTTLEIHSLPRLLQFRRHPPPRHRRGGGGVLAEVKLEESQILWPGGVLYGGGETYENGYFQVILVLNVIFL